MIENARSLNIAASLILVVGILYILGPLYLTLVTASQSHEYMLRNGLAWIPGDQLFSNMARVFSETHIPIQMLNSLAVALGDAIATCVLSFLSAYAIVYFRVRWAGVVFALILATIMLPIEIRVITTYQVASNVFSPVNALLAWRSAGPSCANPACCSSTSRCPTSMRSCVTTCASNSLSSTGASVPPPSSSPTIRWRR
ncbi:UNVERIFIED_ORG: ABC-type glycerol-3-phosphate transport system permease component [Rhizobium etli]